MKSKIYWGIIPLILLMIINIGLSISLKMKATALSSKILSQRQHFIELRKEISKVTHGSDNISNLLVRPVTEELSNTVFCRIEFKDNFVIFFNEIGKEYIMAVDGGFISSPSSFKDMNFNYRILERGVFELKGKSIVLRNSKNNELKRIFMIEQQGRRVLYAYGDLLVPKRYCNKMQYQLYEILKNIK